VLALDTIHGTRIVAAPATLDSVSWPTGVTVLRFAPDDVFVVGGESLSVSGEHAIVAAEAGFVGRWLTAAELDHVAEHIDWPLPAERPALAQGLVAAVPAKLWLGGSPSADHVALLLTNAPYQHELQERLA